MEAASTTGNIAGIYDMVGGSSDYVMGNYNNNINNAGFGSMPEGKYYNLYTTTDPATACSGSLCYGHALSETANWYKNYFAFVNISYPWLLRGGGSNAASIAGIFYTRWANGYDSGGYATARLVIVS